MGCSNNPSTLTFHKDAIPHVPQEFIQSPAGYTKLQKMFYSNMAKQASFKKSRDRSAAYDAALNGRSAQPLNPSAEGPPAQPSTDYVPDAGGPCDGLSGADKSGCLAQHANDGGGRATAVDVTGMLAAHAGSRSGGGGGAHNNGPTRVRATTPTEKRHTTVTPFIPNASGIPAGWSPTNATTPGGSTATATATSTATATATSGTTGASTTATSSPTETADGGSGGGGGDTNGWAPKEYPLGESAAAAFGSTLTGISAGGVASLKLLRDDLALGAPPNNPYGMPNVCFTLDAVATQLRADGSADAKTDLGATTLYCDFLRGLSAGFIDGFVSGWNHSYNSYQPVFAAEWERGRTDGKQAVQRAEPSAAERVRREEAAAARRMTAAREAALEADLLTFAAERGAALDATAAQDDDGEAAAADGGARGTAARRKGLPAWRHGLALLGSASPPPAPPPPPPGGLRHDADLSVMSADAFASDSARLAELSLQGAPPYAVGAMHLETTPVPLPAPAGTVDPKRQWGGAPDGAAPGEPFVDADGAQ